MTNLLRWALSLAVLMSLGFAPLEKSYASRIERDVPHAVVAVVAETGVDVLHPEFRTDDGRDAVLPLAIAHRVVRVDLRNTGSREVRLASLAQTPLAHPRPGTLYYVARTRLLVYWGATASGTVLAAAYHGTGTASLAAGRTTGAAPDALVVAVLGYQQESWAWVAAQPWIDVASSSTFDVVGGALCDSVSGVRAFRQAGHLPFAAAGNSFIETTAIAPGGSPDIVRVGGVRGDGSSALPDSDDPATYSGRAYDTAGLFTNRMASAGTDGYTSGTGTSGSSPQVAGRVASVLARVRRAVGDSSIGARSGALVWTRRRIASGPLKDGSLTANELLRVVLELSQPKSQTTTGRYAVEGYGWFDTDAADEAVEVLLGERQVALRTDDDTAYTTALAVRAALYAAKGCGL